MKTLLLALAVAFGIAVVTRSAPGPMQTVNSLSELSLIPNPLTVASNTFVVTEGVLGDGTSSIWTFVRGATNTPSTDVIVSSTMPAAGRFIRNTPSGGGNVTNIYNTVVTTNLYITTNTYIMQGGYTNQAGLWEKTNSFLQPVDLTLPIRIDSQIVLGPGTTNVLYRSGAVLIYTNGAADVAFSVMNGSGNSAKVEAQGASAVFGTAGGGTTVVLRSGSAQVGLTGGFFFPIVDLAESSGDLNNAWSSNYNAHVIARGFVSGTTNYSLLDMSATTNGIGVFDFQNSGSGSPLDHFSFRSNGVEVATVTSSGAVNGWTDDGINVSTPRVAVPAALITGGYGELQTALGDSTSQTLNLASTNRIWSCFPTGSVTFTVSGATNGLNFKVFLVNTNATNINITFPTSAVFNGYKPTYITAGKQATWFGNPWTVSSTNRIVSAYGEEQ